MNKKLIFEKLGIPLILLLLYAPFDAGATERWYSEAQARNGKAVFDANCAICHGAEAAGTADWRKPLADGRYPAPPLNGTAHGWHHPLANLRQQIKQGGAQFGGWMPALGASLTDEQIDDVIAYFQSLWPDRIYTAWKQKDEAVSKVQRDSGMPNVPEPSAKQLVSEETANTPVQANLLLHLSRRLPNSKFGEPEKTPMKDIFRLSLDGKIIYISSDGRYVFLGDMVDLVSGRNFSKKGVP